MSGFQEEYAAIYDLLYPEKNYEEESQLVRKVINEFRPDAKILLDYGCGTGKHAKELASHGFDVWGLDKNESMLKIARERLRDVPNIELRHVEDRDLIPPDSVDVCTTLFDVISYMNTNEEIIDFLSYVRRILTKKGLLIFDFWYGPGVVALGPEKRRKEFDLGEQSLLRLTSPQHDRDACVVTVTHKVVLSEKERIVSRFSDVHRMRYFFPNEIRLFLVHQGLELLKIGTWQDLDAPPQTNDWSALAVARVVE